VESAQRWCDQRPRCGQGEHGACSALASPSCHHRPPIPMVGFCPGRTCQRLERAAARAGCDNRWTAQLAALRLVSRPCSRHGFSDPTATGRRRTRPVPARKEARHQVRANLAQLRDGGPLRNRKTGSRHQQLSSRTVSPTLPHPRVNKGSRPSFHPPTCAGPVLSDGRERVVLRQKSGEM
jgi:hypothetical protein